MQIQGVPNKYEIFQDFYLEVNGEQISYSDALRLYYQMDDEQKTEFEQYYKDETGYEIITASGYDIPGNVELKTDPDNPDQLLVVGTKTVKKKEIVDGKVTYVDKTVNIYASNLSQINCLNLEMQYNIEAYAKKTGKKCRKNLEVKEKVVPLQSRSGNGLERSRREGPSRGAETRSLTRLETQYRSTAANRTRVDSEARARPGGRTCAGQMSDARRQEN